MGAVPSKGRGEQGAGRARPKSTSQCGFLEWLSRAHDAGMKIPDRRIELFAGTGSGDRFTGPATGGERPMLIAMLDAQRATLELKCSDFGPELAIRSVPPSSLSLLGLVRHLADVERRWFRAVLAGHDVELRFSSTDAPRGRLRRRGSCP